MAPSTWKKRLMKFRQHHRRLVGVLLAILPLSLSIASPAARADTLSVAVAANLQFVFSALQTAFEQKSGHRLQPSFNSSGRLATQIQLGAPFDVFLSADMGFPQQLYQAGFTTGAPVSYARGVLVLWSLKPLDLRQWQTSLSAPTVKRIAIANPTIAPYGREALRTLDFYGLRTALEPKLVYAESISQANQYIYSQAVDAGFTSKSVVLSAAMQGQGSWIEVPAAAYQPIAQGVVMTRYGEKTHPLAARQFHDFLLSPAAQAILARDGYLSP